MTNLSRARIGVIIILFFLISCQPKNGGAVGETSITIPPLMYTKHARCRMDCRHINEAEIKEVLAENHINQGKSNPNDPRGATYAYEGETSERQHLRIIIDKTPSVWKVVTCIDLEHEFECNCH